MMTREQLEEMARGHGNALVAALPSDVVFCLWLFEARQAEEGPSWSSYISNANRDDVISGIGEMTAHMRGPGSQAAAGTYSAALTPDQWMAIMQAARMVVASFPEPQTIPPEQFPEMHARLEALTYATAVLSGQLLHQIHLRDAAAPTEATS